MIDKRTTDWQEDALCRQVDPDCFYPDNEDGGQAENSRALFTAAKRMCRICPVRAECLNYAYKVENDYRYGVWGGYGPAERDILKSKLIDLSVPELREWIEKNDKRKLV